MRTFRAYFDQPISGKENRVNIQIPVDTTSVVLVTACEYNPEEVPPSHPEERRRHLGGALVWVSDIVVHGDDGTANNGVEFHLNVEFPNPIFVLADITVLDPLSQPPFHV
jgi:hypothetical protein